LGDVGGRKNGEGHLVEQRLKGVVVAAVDEGEVDGKMSDAACGVEACKTAADDENAGTGGGNRLGGLGHGGNLLCSFS